MTIRITLLALILVALTDCLAIAAPNDSEEKRHQKYPMHQGNTMRPDPLGAEIVRQLLTCWTQRPVFGPRADIYFPTFRVALKSDGRFARAPELLNPPASSSGRAVVASAVMTLDHCQPLHLPTSPTNGVPAPYVRTVRFVD